MLVAVCIALAGQASIWVRRAVTDTSITAQVSTVTRIWAIDTWKPSQVIPSTKMEMMTAARWIRGSRMLGGTRLYERPWMRT